MVTIKRSLKNYSWQYSFAVDGGAVGTLSAPFTLSVNCIPVLFSVGVLTAGTSGGAATVSFGYGAGSETRLLGATAIASFSSFALLSAFPANLNVLGIASTPSMTIAVAALTAGVFNCSILYYEN